MKLKQAMALAKATGKKVQVTEPTESEVKVNINMRIDLAVLQSLKKEAEDKGLPYQTLIQTVSKQHVNSPSLLERVESLERILKKNKN